MLSQKATVHPDDLSGEKSGLGRGQEKEGIGHVLGGAEAAQRSLIGQILQGFGPQMGIHLGINDPRSHTVYRDTGGTQFPGQGLGEADYAGLGGGVGRLTGGARPPPHGGDGEDAPALPGDHVVIDRPAAVEDAVQVGAHQRPPILVAHVTEQSRPGLSGVAYQNVKLTKIIQHIVNHPLDLFRIGYIGLNRDGGASGVGELLYKGQSGLLRGVIVDGHGVPGCGKDPGGGGADPTAGSGDEDSLLIHEEILSLWFGQAARVIVWCGSSCLFGY